MSSTRTTTIRDRSDKKYFAQVPHFVRLLPMNPLSKLLYWDLKAIAGEAECAPENLGDKLKTEVIAARLGISVGMVSFCKRELVAFGFIEIAADGKHDHIEVLDVWARNIAHMAGTPDVMMAKPPPISAYKTARPYAKKPKQLALDVSGGETLIKKTFQVVKRETKDVSGGETCVDGKSSPLLMEKESSSLREESLAAQPNATIPSAAPNAPILKRKAARKAATVLNDPTPEEEPRMRDTRITMFREVVPVLSRRLWMQDIDAICENVKPENATFWKADAGAYYAKYGAHKDNSISNMVDFHCRQMLARASPQAEEGKPKNRAQQIAEQQGQRRKAAILRGLGLGADGEPIGEGANDGIA